MSDLTSDTCGRIVNLDEATHVAQHGHALNTVGGFAICCGQQWRPASEYPGEIPRCGYCGADRRGGDEHLSGAVTCPECGCCDY